jgi:pimeloyl-ACP methyl ester carboxylesterase
MEASHRGAEAGNAGPGHFLEVEKILPLLTAASPEHPSFHVVAPSLPGYGFSEAPSKPGFGLSQYAEVCHKLMLALGYDKYGQSGRSPRWRGPVSSSHAQSRKAAIGAALYVASPQLRAVCLTCCRSRG